LNQGLSVRRIAAVLEREPSTISREVKRCYGFKGGYRPELAQDEAAVRQRRNPRAFRNRPRRLYVIYKLRCGWSPEQIAGRLKRDASPLYACHETIYRWIYSQDGRERNLPPLLPRHKQLRGRRYARKPRRGIPHATPIAARPHDVLTRQTFGHWEGDLLHVGLFRAGSLTTLVERKSRFTMLLHNRGIYSETIVHSIRRRLASLPRAARATLTLDRGKEFSSHQALHTIGVNTYFCNPQSPWQKGTVENTNGRIRRYLPRGKTPMRFDQPFLDKLARSLNHTPRKCLGFQTPYEAFYANLRNDCCVSQ